MPHGKKIKKCLTFHHLTIYNFSCHEISDLEYYFNNNKKIKF